MDQLTSFVADNILLFGALAVVLVLLIRAELEHQVNKGLLVTPSAAIRLLNNDDKAMVIDVRSTAEYNSGHIKGASNIPLSDFSSSISGLEANKDHTVLVYCNSGHTSSRAVRALKNAGFEKINNLEGGIIAWKDANLPLSKKKK